jgi:hypothetical protein
MKKQFLPALSCALLVATAFDSKNQLVEASPGPQKNFIYTAYPSDNPTDLGNPDNYQLTANDGTEIPFCSGVAHRCSVVAEDDGTGQPDFSRPYTIKTRN